MTKGIDQSNLTEAIYLPISEQLKKVEEILDERVHSSAVPLIREVSKHIISCGGKRFRPALAILSAKICGYPGENASFVAAAIELVHTASLMHDDVLDDANMRRGTPSANVKWGNHISVLVGDYCLSMANQLLSNYGSRSVISVVTDAAIKTTEGEILEVIRSNDLSMDVDSYINIIECKTAWLISASCTTGAKLAEATPRLYDSLKEYGLKLGMAFQIVDDILDYTFEGDQFGKSKGMDLKEGKLTLPLIYALNRCKSEEMEIIKESLLAPTHSDEHFDSVISILNKYDCIKDAKREAHSYAREAQESLSPFKHSLEKESLVKFADYILERRC